MDKTNKTDQTAAPKTEILAIQDAAIQVNAEMRLSVDELTDLAGIPLDLKYEDQIKEQLEEVKRLTAELHRAQEAYNAEILRKDDAAVLAARDQIAAIGRAGRASALGSGLFSEADAKSVGGGCEVDITAGQFDVNKRIRYFTFSTRFAFNRDEADGGGYLGSHLECNLRIPFTDEQNRLRDQVDELTERFGAAKREVEELKKEHVEVAKRHRAMVRMQYAATALRSNSDFSSLVDSVYGGAYVASIRSIAKRLKDVDSILPDASRQIEGK